MFTQDGKGSTLGGDDMNNLMSDLFDPSCVMVADFGQPGYIGPFGLDHRDSWYQRAVLRLFRMVLAYLVHNGTRPGS